jgi:hypothetical protein
MLLGQSESVFRLRNVNIVDLYHLLNCATFFGYMTIFKYTYFPRTYSIEENMCAWRWSYDSVFK